MSQVKRNMVANFLGRGFSSFLAILFVPIYINLIGIEAFGLVGFFASMLVLLNLLDLGMSAALSRELARLSGLNKEDEGREQRTLIHTLETIYWLIAALAGVIVYLSSGTIARYWFNAEVLPSSAVKNAIALMGLVVACRFPFALYSGGFLGLQRHVRLNMILAGGGALRQVGAVIVLVHVSRTVEAYFIWQAVVSAIQTLLTRQWLWHLLPRGSAKKRFSMKALRSLWKFAAGMTGYAAVYVCLMHYDKILLGKILPLDIYGFYMVGVAVANGIQLFTHPFYTTSFPRFSLLSATREEKTIVTTFHALCQALAAVMMPTAMIVAVFSREGLLIWTRDPSVADNAHVIVSFLIIGAALNGFFYIPFALQFAYGKTKLAFLQTLVTFLLAIPALIWLAKTRGAAGAAALWPVINTIWVLLIPHLIFRRILVGQKWNWYFRGVALPTAVSAALAISARILVPVGNFRPIVQLVFFALLWMLSVGAIAMLSPNLRNQIMKWISKAFGRGKS